MSAVTGMLVGDEAEHPVSVASANSPMPAVRTVKDRVSDDRVSDDRVSDDRVSGVRIILGLSPGPVRFPTLHHKVTTGWLVGSACAQLQLAPWPLSML